MAISRKRFLGVVWPRKKRTLSKARNTTLRASRRGKIRRWPKIRSESRRKNQKNKKRSNFEWVIEFDRNLI